MNELADKVALVTGGGSGIGKRIAQRFAEAGAAVFLVGRRQAPIEEAAEALRGAGSRAGCAAGDVSRREDCERAVKQAVEQFGALHVLVNCAGVGWFGTLEDTSDERIGVTLDVDLKGPMLLTRAALAQLRRHKDSGGAAILNVSSSVTLHVVRKFAVYSAAKAGLDQLTRCLALDLAPDRIRVNAICPGIVQTPIFETMIPKAAVPRALAAFAAQHPLGRIGQPEDIAAAALFLCSPAAAWITGAVLPVDGGLSLT
jgi:NAD(P)-dependent dehydrogenase (short-subunit alcohol dehydrogenase family)